MAFTQSEPETVQRKAYRNLRNRILSNQLKPGDQLPQHRIAKEMGIGTNPLREALVRLECEGLIQVVPQWGARVKEWDTSQITFLYELRMGTECQLARLAAVRASDGELAELLDLGRQVDALHDSVPRDHEKLGPLDAKFHKRIAELAQSPLLQEQFERQHVLMQMIRFQEIAGDSYEMENKLHIRLAEGVVTRDPDQADAAMRWHLEYSLKVEMAALYEREHAN